MSLSNRWAETETPQCFSVVWWMWPKVTQSLVSVRVCVSLPLYFYIFGEPLNPKGDSLSFYGLKPVCVQRREKRESRTHNLAHICKQQPYIHASMHTETPWPHEEKPHVPRRIQTSCMWFVFVCLTLFPFPPSFSPSFILFGLLAFLFLTSSSYQSTDRTSQHAHKCHIHSSPHTNSFVCELRESRCTCLFTSVCVFGLSSSCLLLTQLIGSTL